MVGIVVVSHSADVADGVVELAREMGGEEVRIEPAGGMADPPRGIGTDAELIKGAIERAAGDDGVLVLMDLGSALMSAEMAVEMAENAPRVVLSEAPLVEGAIAAAATARGGADLDAVAAEARGALAPKAVQLGVEAADGDASAGGADVVEDGGETLRVTVENRLGLHARPAARLVATVGRFDADVCWSTRAPAPARPTRAASPAWPRSACARATRYSCARAERCERGARGDRRARARELR